MEEEGWSAEIGKKMQAVAKTLSKDRKLKFKDPTKKPVTASRESLSGYKSVASHHLHSAASAKAGIVALDLHPRDQNVVITGGIDQNSIVFNRTTGKIIDTLKGHKKRVTDVKFHPDEKLILTTSADATTIMWTLNSTGKYNLSHTLTDHKSDVIGVTLHPSNSYFVTASADKSWCFYDIESATCRQQVSDEKFQGGYTRVAFHPDGLILGAGTSDSQVRIFDVRAKKNVATFKGHVDAITAIAFSQNGYHLATGDQEGMINFWDLRKLENFQRIESSVVKNVNQLDFDSSGSYLIVAANDIKLFAQNNKTVWELVHSYGDHSERVTSVRFGPEASFFASTSMDKTLKIFAAADN